MFSRPFFLLIAVAVALTGQPLLGWSGEIYKYVDERGNVFFSDTPPPPGTKLEKVYEQKQGLDQPAETEADNSEAGKTDEEKVTIPFRGRSGRTSGRREMVVDVTLVRGARSIAKKFVVDTGATNTVITQADAKALGIKERDVTDSSLGRVAGGGSVVAHQVKLSRLKVGDLVVTSPKVIVLRMGERLLGMDILGKYNMQVDNDKRLLILEKR